MLIFSPSFFSSFSSSKCALKVRDIYPRYRGGRKYGTLSIYGIGNIVTVVRKEQQERPL